MINAILGKNIPTEAYSFVCLHYADNYKDAYEITEKVTEEECVDFLKKEADIVKSALPMELYQINDANPCAIASLGEIKTPKRDVFGARFIKVFFEKEKLLVIADYKDWTPQTKFAGGYVIHNKSPFTRVIKKIARVEFYYEDARKRV